MSEQPSGDIPFYDLGWDPSWLCSCGHYQEDSSHCASCGCEPPQGCDCGEHDEREDYGSFYEYDGPPLPPEAYMETGPWCSTCGAEMERVPCTAIGCEDGWVDGYEDDPLWFEPGELERCGECGGEGGWWVCPDAKQHEPDADSK